MRWEWDNRACLDYNIVAKLEETLINLEVIKDFSNIEDTEKFVNNFKEAKDVNGNNRKNSSAGSKSDNINARISKRSRRKNR